MFLGCFRGYNLVWHGAAMLLTYVCVTTGFDWWYFESTRSDLLFSLAISAAPLGFLIPVFLPFALYVFGVLRQSPLLKKTSFALAYAAILGSAISSIYKAFTGRIQPEFFYNNTSIDISRDFNFGFFQNGIFWGWPSSHTAVAFALAAALATLFPHRKAITIPAIITAVYIGLGVSVTIHWFSDFLAGAILGCIIGITVGRFLKKTNEKLDKTA